MISFETAMLANLFTTVLFIVNRMQLTNEIRNLKNGLTTDMTICKSCGRKGNAYAVDPIAGRCHSGRECNYWSKTYEERVRDWGTK